MISSVVISELKKQSFYATDVRVLILKRIEDTRQVRWLVQILRCLFDDLRIKRQISLR